MGAWGSGVFENDFAADWCAELTDQRSVAMLGEALDAVLRAEDVPEARECAAALAAAEVVAVLHGRPARSVPREVVEWAAGKRAPSTSVRKKVQRALDAIAAESELLDLVEESGKLKAWRRLIGDLKARLNRPPKRLAVKTNSVPKAATARRTRPVLGELFEIRLKRGFAYGQYVNHHRKGFCYGELVRVLPGKFKQPLPLEDVRQNSRAQELYVCFYPLALAAHKDFVRLLGRCPIPQRCRRMPRFKACNINFLTGKKTWFVWDGKSAKSEMVKKLSAEQAKYPIEQLIGLDRLAARIQENWSPVDEIRDLKV